MAWLTLERGIVIGSVIIGSFILSITLRKLITIFVVKYAKRLKADPTNFSFLKNSIPFIISVAAIIFIFYYIPSFRQLGKSSVRRSWNICRRHWFCASKDPV